MAGPLSIQVHLFFSLVITFAHLRLSFSIGQEEHASFKC